MPEPLDPEFEQLLRSRGATDDDIDRARAMTQHLRNAMATDLLLWPKGSLAAADVADEVGISLDRLVAWWRSLGLADPTLPGAQLNDDDVEVARVLAMFTEFVPERVVDDLARVFGASTHQVANAGVNAWRVGFEQPLRQQGTLDSVITSTYGEIMATILPGVVRMFDTLFRRYIVMSVYDDVAVNDDGSVQAVQSIVFVDVVDYTGLAQRCDAVELAGLLSTFERVASESASRHNGRLVKFLGDGAMLSFGRRDDAIAAALACVRNPDVAACRAGVATGQVLTRQGDFYGPVVNLASRLSGVVAAGEVALDGKPESTPSEPMAPVVLKGYDEPVTPYRVR